MKSCIKKKLADGMSAKEKNTLFKILSLTSCLLIGLSFALITNNVAFSLLISLFAKKALDEFTKEKETFKIVNITIKDIGSGVAEVLEEATHFNGFNWQIKWITFNSFKGYNLPIKEPWWVKNENILSYRTEKWTKEQLEQFKKTY